jgi:hypothetical protein
MIRQIYKQFSNAILRKIIPLLGTVLLVACSQYTSAQSGRSYVLAGADTVNAGSSAGFNLNPSGAGNWTVSCGTITIQTAGSVTVNFASAGCSTAVITASSGGSVLATKKITIVSAAVLTPGTIVNATQTINYGRIPGLLSAPAAAGGACGGTYTYQWLSSSDNINFSPIAGATGQNYQPGALTATTYFKRQSGCGGSTQFTGNSVQVTVYPAMTAASLSPATQTVNYNGSPGTLSLGPLASIGANISYQWQSASNGSFSTVIPINGTGSSSYTPGNLGSTTYYRVALIRAGDTSYSSPAVVSVFPQLNAGSVNPASQTVGYDSVPLPLTSVGVSGGSGTYVYQWYSSADNTNWNLLSGVNGPEYSPGGLTSTTWFRVTVTSNGAAMTSAAAVVNVNASTSTGQ